MCYNSPFCTKLSYTMYKAWFFIIKVKTRLHGGEKIGIDEWK